MTAIPSAPVLCTLLIKSASGCPSTVTYALPHALPLTFASQSQDLTLEEFTDRFERPRIPVVISGLTDDWPAQASWTEERLLATFPDHRFKVVIIVLLLFADH